MSEMKKIVFDVDGVILNVPEMRKKMVKEMLGVDLEGKDLFPKVFKEKFPEKYREVSWEIYRSSEVKIYDGVLEILKKLVEEKREFILLSERRSEEEEKAQWENLEKNEVLEIVGKERVMIVRATHDKIPVMQAFGQGEEKMMVIDDGLDKIGKLQKGGVEAEWIWVDEFWVREEMEVSENVRVVSGSEEVFR